jgi:hypothetical protein
MSEPKIIAVEFQGPVYFSSLDEAMFFEWLRRIPAVTRTGGEIRTFRVFVDPAKLNEDGLLELVGLFKRYKLPIRALAVFADEDYAQPLKVPGRYWYDDLFGKSAP